MAYFLRTKKSFFNCKNISSLSLLSSSQKVKIIQSRFSWIIIWMICILIFSPHIYVRLGKDKKKKCCLEISKPGSETFVFLTLYPSLRLPIILIPAVLWTPEHRQSWTNCLLYMEEQHVIYHCFVSSCYILQWSAFQLESMCVQPSPARQSGHTKHTLTLTPHSFSAKH